MIPYRSPVIAQLAAEEFLDRHKAAKRLVAERRASGDRAHAELLPFMRLACELDADLPWIRDLIAEERAPVPAIVGEWRDPGERLCRMMIADDLCNRAAVRAALIKSRDRAIERAQAEPTRWPRASRLTALAWAYRCPPYAAPAAQPERKAA